MADLEAFRRALGVRIVTLRREAGFTQTELADRAGISNEFMSRIEHGSGTPSLDTLVRLSDALSVQPCQLLQSESGGASAARQRLDRQIARMSDEKVELVARLAEQVARVERRQEAPAAHAPRASRRVARYRKDPRRR